MLALPTLVCEHLNTPVNSNRLLRLVPVRTDPGSGVWIPSLPFCFFGSGFTPFSARPLRTDPDCGVWIPSLFPSLWLLAHALFEQIQTLESGSLRPFPSLELLAHALFGQIQTLESGSLYPFPSLWLLAHALFGQIQTLETGSLYPFPSPLFGSWLTPSSDRSKLWNVDPFTLPFPLAPGSRPARTDPDSGV